MLICAYRYPGSSDCFMCVSSSIGTLYKYNVNTVCYSLNRYKYVQQRSSFPGLEDQGSYPWPVYQGTRWRLAEPSITIDSPRTPSHNLNIHTLLHTWPVSHPRLQYWVIPKLIMDRPPTHTINTVLGFVILIMHSSFLEIDYTSKPAPTLGELTHVRSLVLPFAEVDEESSGHHARNTAKTCYSVLLESNGARTEDLVHWWALPIMSLARRWEKAEGRFRPL